jgi:hypothetical protein
MEVCALLAGSTLVDNEKQYKSKNPRLFMYINPWFLSSISIENSFYCVLRCFWNNLLGLLRSFSSLGRAQLYRIVVRVKAIFI